MALAPNDVRRAVSSAALLTSDRDGEVVAAARALCVLLAKGGLDPRSVITSGLAREAWPNVVPSRVTAQSPYGSWQQVARMARLSPHLNDWERGFLADILAHGSLSQRQESCLKAILVKSEGTRS